MAVAEKHKQDTSTAGLLDRLPVAVFMGVIYVYGSLGIIFPGLNYLWWTYVYTDRTNPVAWVGILSVGAALAVGLTGLGLVLLGPRPMRGLRAGIFLGTAWLALGALLGVYVGAWIESLLYARAWFGPADRTGGIAITAGLLGVLLITGIWLLLKPRTEKFLGDLEDQGWFSGESYKRNQGQRVRRGTIIGLLLVVGFGLLSLNRTLERDPGDWTVGVPYTDQVRITAATAGDNPLFKRAGDPDDAVYDRFQVRDINRAFEDQFVKIGEPGSPGNEDRAKREFEKGEIVPKSVFLHEQEQRNKYRKTLEEKGDANPDLLIVQAPTEVKVAPASGTPEYTISLTLLPAYQYTVPLLLAVLTLWLAWRIVNYPAFADFLIATEAELNKVSWVTRRQLAQDTIVVLVTVLLMTFFLFFADIGWSQMLKGIGVLHPGQSRTQQAEQNIKW